MELETEGKRALRRPRCRWLDNIKLDISELKWKEVEWFQVAQNTTGYCYGVVPHTASHALRPFYDLLCSTSEL
jgi:hypothetical protein